jgi:hypothetical protein
MVLSVLGDTSNTTDLVRLVQQGTALVVSDGSYHSSFATMVLIITDVTGGPRLMNKVIAPGGPSDMSALCTFFKITSGGIELGCDGLSALYKSFSTPLNLNPKDPS